MKPAKTILAGLLALGFAVTANAQTKMYFTGSTAFRAQTHKAIMHALGSIDGTTLTSGSYGYVGSTLSGAGSAIFFGSLSGTSVIIKTTWTGAEAGIQTVAQDGTGIPVKFLPDNTAASPNGTGGALDPTSGSNPNDSQIPDVAMSDTFQSTSQFFGGATIVFGGTSHTFATLTESPNSPVGVVVFKWVARTGSSATPAFTNITSQQARQLYKQGRLPLALFTGNNADEAKAVFAVGRDPDSGSRLATFAETGIGATSVVTQYQPLDNTGTLITATGSQVAKMIVWPASTVNGISVVTGNGGYNSGGKAAGALGSNVDSFTNSAGTVTYTGATLVTYLGTSDAATAIAAGASELSYNGVSLGTYSDYNNATVLTEGKYTFWSYEHLYYRSGSPVAGLADIIANQIKTVDAPVLMSNMKVTRATDGANVKNNYATP